MDSELFAFIYGFAGRFKTLDLLAVFFAEYFPYFLLITALIVVFRYSKTRLRLYYVVLMILSGLLGRGFITEAVRFFYPRLRPYAALHVTSLVREVSASFPSGHAVFYGMLATAILLLHRKAGLWMWGGVLVMGIARIFAGVHWPSDIIGGFGIGILSVLVTRQLIQKFYRVQETQPETGDRPVTG